MDDIIGIEGEFTHNFSKHPTKMINIGEVVKLGRQKLEDVRMFFSLQIIDIGQAAINYQ